MSRGPLFRAGILKRQRCQCRLALRKWGFLLSEECTALVTRTGVIYMLTSPSGKSYIGQSINLAPRLRRHRCADAGCAALSAAVQKYGFDSFKVDLLVTGVPRAALNWWEGFFVSAMGTLSPGGYNLAPGGNAKIGMSEETRARMILARSKDNERRSEAMRVRWKDPVYRETVAKAVATVRSAPAYRQMMSVVVKRRSVNPEYLAGISKRNKARWNDPAYRETHHRAIQSFCGDPIYLAKLSAAQKRIRSAPAARAKQSEMNRKRWADPEFKAKMRATMSSVDYRANMSSLIRARELDPVYLAQRAVRCADPSFGSRISEGRKASAARKRLEKEALRGS